VFSDVGQREALHLAWAFWLGSGPGEHLMREIRFKILWVHAGADLPGSTAAREYGCSCPAGPNRAGIGLAVSDMTTRRGFWIDNLCKAHGHLLKR
jgi:hypothetical protein